jgi:hypothetical protein
MKNGVGVPFINPCAIYKPVWAHETRWENPVIAQEQLWSAKKEVQTNNHRAC